MTYHHNGFFVSSVSANLHFNPFKLFLCASKHRNANTTVQFYYKFIPKKTLHNKKKPALPCQKSSQKWIPRAHRTARIYIKIMNILYIPIIIYDHHYAFRRNSTIAHRAPCGSVPESSRLRMKARNRRSHHKIRQRARKPRQRIIASAGFCSVRS